MASGNRRWFAAALCGALAVVTACESEPAEMNGPVKLVASVSERALDATPSADGERIFFTAEDGGSAALYEAEDGGPTMIVGGFTELRSVAVVGGDALLVGQRDGGAAGGLYRASLDGGEPQAIAEDLGARSVTATADALYVAGVDPASSTPAVFRIPGGGAPELVQSGIPVDHVDGVASVGDELYVAAMGASGGEIWRLQGATTQEKIAEGLTLGTPAGIAATLDGSTLLVSSLAADGTSQVVLIDLADRTQTIFDDVIGDNQSSGGVHRAVDANVFAWADYTGGRVYRIDL